MTHWTTGSAADFAYFVSADFMMQIELQLEKNKISKKRFAQKIGVEPSRVSQLLHNPGNLEVASMVKCTLALGKKLAVVVYDDGDPTNMKGPVSGDMFRESWEKMHSPRDMFALEGVAATRIYHREQQDVFYRCPGGLPHERIAAAALFRHRGHASQNVFEVKFRETKQSVPPAEGMRYAS
jgi:predicted XRE-type DNA-binding protein